MSINIRSYTPDDKEFITSLASRFSQFDLPLWRTKAEIDSSNQNYLSLAAGKLEENSTIFIAEDENGAPAGFVHLKGEFDYFNGEPFGYISDLAVAPDFEGQGVGQVLLDVAEAWGHEKGYRLLALYVFAGNERARYLYEKNGFGEEVIKYVKEIKQK
jgi:ribosomal protein S18 acetylase RimI-like enzyme